MSERLGALDRGCLERARDSLERGEPFKSTLERLLLELDERQANWLMQELREGRGAWAPLVVAGGGGPDQPQARSSTPRALYIGGALCGTPIALGRLGFEVTTLARDGLRLALAEHRARALLQVRAHFVLGGDSARLPFDDASFDLVVQDCGLPGPRTGWGHGLAECARVARGELVLIADNRLGYKRSSGAHGQFHVLRPLEFARAAARPERAERTLAGYRRALERVGLSDTRAFALYPHSGQFVHVVGLDGPRPRLPVGPKERRNRLKLLGAALGLFPVFTPSFAVLARSGASDARARIDRILAQLAERFGEPAPEVDQLVATRGNSSVVLTAPAAEDDDPDGPGRWCLHLPLSPSQQVLVERHHRTLWRLRRSFPGVPVATPLFAGVVDGVYLVCERRLGGRTAPELSDDPGIAARLLEDAARITAQLALGPSAPVSAADFEALLGFKFELVLRHGQVPATLEKTGALRERARELLVGRRLPRCLYHADLRGKHIQIDAEGGVLGILDWGTLEDPGLPYVDLLHLVIHERKQTEALTAGAAWRAVCDPSRRLPHEARALADYAERLALEPDYLKLIEDCYPVLVGAMAESNWDYSRPRWVHTQFTF